MFSDIGSPPGFFHRQPAVGRQHLKRGHQIADTHCVLPPGGTLREAAKVQIPLLIRIHEPPERKTFWCAVPNRGTGNEAPGRLQGRKVLYCLHFPASPTKGGGVREPEKVLLKPFSRIEINVF